MKEAYIVFPLLLALQAPILVFPLLFNTSARVACRQELTMETPPPESGFLSVPVPLPLEQCLVLQVKIFKTPKSSPAVCPASHTLG